MLRGKSGCIFVREAATADADRLGNNLDGERKNLGRSKGDCPVLRQPDAEEPESILVAAENT
ncbi:MAG: hypothetical protein WB424_07880, partial [Terracidiphilus sp.]